jgi:hypothetical protein
MICSKCVALKKVIRDRFQIKKGVEYEECGKEVDELDLDRYGECRACRAHDRATDMGVGDINTK